MIAMKNEWLNTLSEQDQEHISKALRHFQNKLISLTVAD